MRYAFVITAVLAAVFFTGCLSVYKVEIQQGNVVTQEMIDKLRPGMTHSQVRYVLGTPLITDIFHQNRWDYYYYLRKSGDKTGESQRLTVIFKNDSMVSIQGDTKIKSDKAPADESGKQAPVVERHAPVSTEGATVNSAPAPAPLTL